MRASHHRQADHLHPKPLPLPPSPVESASQVSCSAARPPIRTVSWARISLDKEGGAQDGEEAGDERRGW